MNGQKFVVDEQVLESKANADNHFGTAEKGLVGEGSEELFTVKGRKCQWWDWEVDHQYLVRGEGGDQAADSGGFARANFTSEQTNVALAAQVATQRCALEVGRSGLMAL